MGGFFVFCQKVLKSLKVNDAFQGIDVNENNFGASGADGFGDADIKAPTVGNMDDGEYECIKL